MKYMLNSDIYTHGRCIKGTITLDGISKLPVPYHAKNWKYFELIQAFGETGQSLILSIWY